MKKRPLPPHVILHSEKGEKVFSGVRYDIYQWQQPCFDGSVRTFEVVKRNDSVVVIAVKDDKILIMEEEQPHLPAPYFGFPAGAVEGGEDLEEAARRELIEETGYTPQNMYLVNVSQYASSIEWFSYCFIANGIGEQGEKSLDGGEKNNLKWLSFDELCHMIRFKKFLFRSAFLEDYLLRNDEEGLKDLLFNPAKHTIA